MAGWHHRLNGQEFEQAPGNGEGQGNLACCSPWVGHDLVTEQHLYTLMITGIMNVSALLLHVYVSLNSE